MINRSHKMVIACLIAGFSTGCATLSNRDKSLVMMLGAGAAGGAVGYVATPSGFNPTVQGVFWGSVSAAAAGIASLFIFDSEKDKQELKMENQKLQAEIQRFEKETELIPQGSLSEQADMPASVKEMIRPGRWNLYKIGENGQWIKENDKRYVHKDQVLIYQPGGLSAGNHSSGSRLESNLSFQYQELNSDAGRLDQKSVRGNLENREE